MKMASSSPGSATSTSNPAHGSLRPSFISDVYFVVAVRFTDEGDDVVLMKDGNLVHCRNAGMFVDWSLDDPQGLHTRLWHKCAAGRFFMIDRVSDAVLKGCHKWSM